LNWKYKKNGFRWMRKTLGRIDIRTMILLDFMTNHNEPLAPSCSQPRVSASNPSRVLKVTDLLRNLSDQKKLISATRTLAIAAGRRMFF
jgi:hypothetical protein